LTGFDFISLELTPNSIPYKEFKTKNLQNTVLILGNEVSGVEDELLDISNKILEIPMSGNKESLNVAISFAVVAFYLRDNFSLL
jgi:23S rRNA (guanosine2251-2'-O)-methyltransferase